MKRAMRTVLLGALAVGLMAAGEADARTERLRWTHPDPSSVDRYTIHVGSASGQYDVTQDVVAPPTDVDNNFYADVTVADDATVFVAVSAWGSGLESPLSNEGRRDAPPPPGGGGGGGGSTGPEAQIVQFALWNADTEELIDGDFQLDEAVFLADTPCTAIVVIGNAYLESGSGPGSVRFTIDGGVPACTEPGVSHDDASPYVLGAEAGPFDIACADVLTVPGTHTLAAAPFDGDGCTGDMGATRLIRFDVVEEPVVPPPPQPLGQPGRPTLVPF